ncbi:hypothetical protein JVU11DRAFT_7293 [Chiua virens]|nr:hypothetical protein JVU11DRAFT_7293 [Chiua virens]
MSHLLFWPTVTYFYPVGNTSAVCLTENLSPESKADILLLACGDPRHILYTIYANETNSLAHSRVLDITCCDIDPAIIARNVLLFTLLADNGVPDKLNSLWDLFYHMFIDKRTLSMLFEQCRKLIPLAENMESWRAGPYGHFLTTCDAATLAHLRRVWTTYLDVANLSPEQAKRFEQRFREGMKDMRQKTRGGTTTASRSAGPLVFDVSQAVGRQFDSYWTSGITDDSTQGQKRRLTINPTFAFSIDGGKFSVHYGTDPLCGFHLAEEFASGKFTRPREQIVPRDVVNVAKDQFSHWCTSVSKRLKDTNPSSYTFVLRMFAGDALLFCQALKYCDDKQSPVTPYTVGPWRLSTITLDDYYYGQKASSSAPLSFNVIDTSNVLDHVGLVNLLVVTVPLLSKTSSATLYTEALLKTGTGKNPSQAILDHLCGDLPTMALLLGIIPATFISQFTTRSNVHESLTMGESSKQYHERLAWKTIGFQQTNHALDHTPISPQRACFSSEDLAGFFLRVYLHMFSDEDMRSKFQLFSLSPEQMTQKLRLSSVLHYNRRSFALLVQFVKTRVHTDWQRTMDLFRDMVMADRRLLMGQHAFQELYCQLHLLGVCTAPWPSVRELLDLDSDCLLGLFRDWPRTRIPTVITLALVVPRDAIARLEPDFVDAGTPVLQCDICDGGLRQNCFAVTLATFGTLHVSGTGEHRAGVVVQGDTEAGVMIDFSRNSSATVGLQLRSTLGLPPKFVQKLGLDLTIFRTRLLDTQRVFVLARPPIVGTGTDTSTSTSIGAVMSGHSRESMEGASTAPGGTSNDIHVKMDDVRSTIQTFTVRVDVTNPGARAVLSDVQTVPTVRSSSGGTRCFDASVRIGTHTFPVHFPLPVDVTRAKLRVARKSSYVEASHSVVVSPASFDVHPERDLVNRFSSLSLSSNDDGTPTLGCIHRVNLDRCPTFKLPKKISDISWYHVHVTLMFSELERERACRVSEIESSPAAMRSPTGTGTAQEAPDTLRELKRSLHSLLGSAAGSSKGSQGPEDVFALFDTERRAQYLYIIVARMRLDVGSHTVVADAFVVEATPTVRALLNRALYAKSMMSGGPRRTEGDGIRYIKTDRDETEAWFHLIPRLTERCRTWSHKVTCIYRQGTSKQDEQGSDSMWETRDSFCTCGLGVGTDILPKHFRPLAPYLTRAAFSPLFPVSYLKEVDVPADGPVNTRTPQDSNNVAKQAPSKIQNQDNRKTDTNSGAIENHCRSCGKEGSLQCSRCKRVRYCSQACQRADWKAHKNDCAEH